MNNLNGNEIAVNTAELKEQNSRREFLRSACGICGLAIAAPSLLLLPGCASTMPVFKGATLDAQKLKVPASAFASNNMMIVRNGQLDWDILLVKNSDNYKALQLKCTHRDQPLSATSTLLHCNEHGSEFDLEGKVTHGPARNNLRTYPALLENDTIIITVT